MSVERKTAKIDLLRWKKFHRPISLSAQDLLNLTPIKRFERNCSFEANQSFPKVARNKKRIQNVKMERLQGDGLQSISFSSTPKRGSFINHLPACMSTSRDENWLSTTQSVYSAFNESSFLCINPNKAVFTLQLPSSQILIVNSVACKLLSHTSDELCTMKLEDLLVDHHKKYINVLARANEESADPEFENGKVVEMITKDQQIVAVSLFIKRVDTPHRCLAIAEPVERRFAQLLINLDGKIQSCDEEAATIFQYEQSDLYDVLIETLIPSINYSKGCDVIPKDTRKQKTTGKAKDGSIFPLCLVLNTDLPSPEHIQVKLWVYSNLSGLLVLNEELLIHNCNHYFTKILFGYPKNNLINEKVFKIIPNFCDDELATDRTMATYDTDNSSSCSDDDNALDEDVFCKKTELNNEQVLNFKTWDTTLPKCNDGMHCDTKSSDISDKCGYKKDSEIKDGTYVGFGRHIDGSNIDIIYHVKTIVLNECVSYLVWISRDPWESVIGKSSVPRTKLTLTSSFNSASIDGSFAKQSNSRNARPSCDSMISQCDEILTAGEYCEQYTNLEQIGKGAFGYVKMAFRNSDGFLVITKFIKKQKINVKSWVIDPQLNMKVPLEISLLTTLNHPNIVKVLDVFHNDTFFQMVMEKHGAGLDLFEFIDRKPKTDELLNSYIFRQIVSAVHYLHSLGILHRDIKDENVIINEKFQVKLIDFGSATFRAEDRMFSTFYGTLEYCSPEVLQGNKYKGPELEIWALGVTLFVVTFGENPFYGVEETIKAKYSFPKPVSPSLSELISSMLEKDVNKRCNLDELMQHPWINQSVDIENYKFESVVKCFPDEAYPPKYISEYCRSYPNEEIEPDIDDDRTVASSNSFCSLNTIENLDCIEEINIEESSMVLKPATNLTIPSFILSSTPIARKTKSANLKYKTSENLTTDVRFRPSRNINVKDKRLSLDPSLLNNIHKNINMTNLCDSKSCDRFDKVQYPELSTSCNEIYSEFKNNDLETEIFAELEKLKLSENIENLGFEKNREQAGSSEFYDAIGIESNKIETEFENYWDAEDEKDVINFS